MTYNTFMNLYKDVVSANLNYRATNREARNCWKYMRDCWGMSWSVTKNSTMIMQAIEEMKAMDPLVKQDCSYAEAPQDCCGEKAPEKTPKLCGVFPPANLHGKMLRAWYRDHAEYGLPDNWQDRPHVIIKSDYFAHPEPPAQDWCITEEGINPMYGSKSTTPSMNITVTPTASAAVEAKTDLQQQREYLLSALDTRFGYWSNVMTKLRGTIRKQFNMDGPERPRTFDELVATIKAGEYETDAKKLAQAKEHFDEYGYEDYDSFEDYVASHYGTFGLVKFTKFPGADRAGFNAAETALTKAISDAKDTIMIQDPKDGLAALQALENWTPPAGTVAS